ncbi:ATP-binding protein [Phytoactinopolyspora endophytica]|uniref:ATP-binding protein n=1 Tax=Phytoactinopolyspora endophytica TaxID=1642495 RepID=UPI0013EAD528|nr:DUF4143 domain-containing protein [Phytoactinopolyspora endophytica]
MHRRAIERVLSERLDESQVVRLSGPRAAGKTTSCVAEMTRRGGSIVRLDDPDERHAVTADPKGYLAGLKPPVLIDEYQRAPIVLDVIKTHLSSTPSRVGTWLLSGSVSIEAVTGASESLGGRLTDVRMGTLTLDERNDLPEPAFLAHLLADGPAFLRGWRADRPLSREQLLDEAVRSGFPLIADRQTPSSRRRGIDDWVNASVIADGAAVGGVRDTEGLRRMLRLYASATASIQPKDSPVAEQLELNRRTVANYRDLLSSLYVTWDLPAFVPGNASSQVVKSPKLHLADAGLAAALAGRDGQSALDRDSRFAGALVETMVANDLRVQASAHETTPRLHHYREGTNEVDLVIESDDGSLLGVEVKLASNPGNRDLNGLRKLRQSSGSRWAGGLVLCRVPAGRITDDELVLAPLEALWQVV